MGRVVFALTLDKKRMTERIVIGKTHEARRRLEHNEGDVYYDETRPIGSLLFTFESDYDRIWNVQVMTLRDSYSKALPFSSARWRIAAPVSNFLTEKYKSGEPSAMFAAIRTWEDYLNCFNMNHSTDLLTEKLVAMYKPFSVYAELRPWRDGAAAALSTALRDGESIVELWYPVAKRPFETVVAVSSFLPVIFYYTHKIKEWGYVYQHCKVCGTDFIARSRHYELCSKKCRKEQAVIAKREYDERAKGDRLEQLDTAAYDYWYNRLRKLRKAANPEKTAAFKTAFDTFRKEAVKRKADVKRRESELKDFSDWLVLMQDEADTLMGGE